MKKRGRRYRRVEHTLDILNNVDEEIAGILQTLDHLHIHILTEHASEFVLQVKRQRREYHELQGVILTLGVDEVLEELGRGALHISTILYIR